MAYDLGQPRQLKEIDWTTVKRVLVVKLRSIGDTVLSTPSLIALQRFLPDAEIDIVLEDWVAPVLDGFEGVNVVPVRKDQRLAIARQLRKRKYDVAFNLHGGTTATFLVRASGATHRVGLANYQFPFLYNHLLSSSADFWETTQIHSAEQQLALIGSVGVPVDDRPKSRLTVTNKGRTVRVSECLDGGSYALLHPGTAFFTKQWPAENFAQVAEYLTNKGLHVVAIASKSENALLNELKTHSKVPIATFDDLTLPEITALASKACVFVGNDSGIAHIAAAVNTPSVVIFGSSNRVHWRPWTDAPNEIVFKEFHCQPCAGYECKEFGTPRCILEVPPSAVFTALERVLSASNS
jgi:lipopolysaccharide heptosyltransferase II